MNNITKKRTSLVFLFFCCGYLAILANLYYLQIINHTFFAELAHKQYFISIKQLPPRAPIFDRHGNYLAMNKESLAAFITPNNITSPETLLPFMAQHFPKALERLPNYKNNSFMYLQRKLTDAQIQAINQANLSDIKLLTEPSRFYPMDFSSPLIGITSIDNEGLFGIEHQFNKQLAGTPSTVALERDARSGRFYFSQETKVAGNTGTPVKLTIDSTLQFLAHAELEKTMQGFQAKVGAVIIMDPTTGDILALVTSPYPNPTELEKLDLEATKIGPIMDTHELGSVIKVFAALAAIEDGVVTLEEEFDCKNSKTAYIDGRKINTVLAGGMLTLPQIMEQSNNIGIAQVAKRVGPALYDHYTRLGFGKKTNIPLAGEQKGFVNHPQNWSKQSLISLSYGYEISGTLLQLAGAFCVIARDGTAVAPRIILDGSAPQVSTTQLYKPESIAVIKQILEGAAIKRRRSKKSALEQVRVMSKTGTANLLIDGVYEPNRNIFTCAGIVEKDTYKRVIVTFIKEANKKNLLAATVSAPLFDSIAEKMVMHDKVL